MRITYVVVARCTVRVYIDRECLYGSGTVRVFLFAFSTTWSYAVAFRAYDAYAYRYAICRGIYTPRIHSLFVPASKMQGQALVISNVAVNIRIYGSNRFVRIHVLSRNSNKHALYLLFYTCITVRTCVPIIHRCLTRILKNGCYNNAMNVSNDTLDVCVV